MTCPEICILSAFRDNGSLNLRSRNEESAVFRRTDCSDIARGGSFANSRGFHAPRSQRTLDLQLAKKFSDLGIDDVKRLKQLEQENSYLKKILPEYDFEIEIMKEIAVKKW